MKKKKGRTRKSVKSSTARVTVPRGSVVQDRAMKPSPATHSRVLQYIAQCQPDTTFSITSTTPVSASTLENWLWNKSRAGFRDSSKAWRLGGATVPPAYMLGRNLDLHVESLHADSLIARRSLVVMMTSKLCLSMMWVCETVSLRVPCWKSEGGSEGRVIPTRCQLAGPVDHRCAHHLNASVY